MTKHKISVGYSSFPFPRFFFSWLPNIAMRIKNKEKEGKEKPCIGGEELPLGYDHCEEQQSTVPSSTVLRGELHHESCWFLMCLDSLLRSLMMSALTQTGILEVLRPLLIISLQEWNESLSVCVSQISKCMCLTVCLIFRA